ncbi:hypothetical protein MKK70_09095 [Methylobacterium sp. E-041]|uniref:hypothetical protein n=1 Tax=Methylobacterium sp. E-041 TaxID=2836573 RepID=UPI001FB8849F|nr:hypothetical protein [Methylobacterium sp. E-041]MCJ2105533.1 hypothetical protein [Methylobacterium sp. E-041]
MNEADLDEQVAQVMIGLIRARRTVDPNTFDCLVGAVLAEIQVGLDIAEEQALERVYRRPVGGNVIQFPVAIPERNGEP